MTPRPFAPDSALVHDVVAAVNVEPRRGVETPTMLVQHYTGMQTAAKAITLACVRGKPRLLPLRHRRGRPHHAAGAGTACAPGTPASRAGMARRISTQRRSASRSITPAMTTAIWDFPDAQIAARDRPFARHHRAATASGPSAWSPIPTSRHSARSIPARSSPGRGSPRAGIGHWVQPSPVRERITASAPAMTAQVCREAQALLARYGYDVPVSGHYDRVTTAAVTAFQRHFRPARCDGRVDLSTLATLERLLAALPPRSIA